MNHPLSQSFSPAPVVQWFNAYVYTPLRERFPPVVLYYPPVFTWNPSENTLLRVVSHTSESHVFLHGIVQNLSGLAKNGLSRLANEAHKPGDTEVKKLISEGHLTLCNPVTSPNLDPKSKTHDPEYIEKMFTSMQHVIKQGDIPELVYSLAPYAYTYKLAEEKGTQRLPTIYGICLTVLMEAASTSFKNPSIYSALILERIRCLHTPKASISTISELACCAMFAYIINYSQLSHILKLAAHAALLEARREVCAGQAEQESTKALEEMHLLFIYGENLSCLKLKADGVKEIKQEVGASVQELLKQINSPREKERATAYETACEISYPYYRACAEKTHILFKGLLAEALPSEAQVREFNNFLDALYKVLVEKEET